jgi:hypothetical protein
MKYPRSRETDRLSWLFLKWLFFTIGSALASTLVSLGIYYGVLHQPHTVAAQIGFPLFVAVAILPPLAITARYVILLGRAQRRDYADVAGAAGFVGRHPFLLGALGVGIMLAAVVIARLR